MHAILLTFVCTAHSKKLSALCGFELSTACGNGSKSALDTTLCRRMVAMVRQDGHRKGERNIWRWKSKSPVQAATIYVSCDGSEPLLLLCSAPVLKELQAQVAVAFQDRSNLSSTSDFVHEVWFA